MVLLLLLLSLSPPQGVLHELLGGLTTGPASNTPAADLATAVLAGAQVGKRLDRLAPQAQRMSTAVCRAPVSVLVAKLRYTTSKSLECARVF